MARSNETRSELYEKLLGNYDYFFGRLRRRRRDEVPSDHFRKQIIVTQILNQVDARRAWLEEQAKHSHKPSARPDERRRR
jgi:hypothetical protein